MKINTMNSYLKTQSPKRMSKFLSLALVVSSVMMLTACTESDIVAKQKTLHQVTSTSTAMMNIGQTRGGWNDTGSAYGPFSVYTWNNTDEMRVCVLRKETGTAVSNAIVTWPANVTPLADSLSAEISWEKELDVDAEDQLVQIMVNKTPSSTSTYFYNHDHIYFGSICSLPNAIMDTTFNNQPILVTPYKQRAYNDMTHLQDYSCIYSVSEGTVDGNYQCSFGNNIKFTYMPTVFRFSITNMMQHDVLINRFLMVCNNPHFTAHGAFMASSVNDVFYRRSDSLSRGVKIDVTNPTLLANGSSARLYGLTFPFSVTDYASDVYTFYVEFTYIDNQHVRRRSIGEVSGTLLRNVWSPDKDSYSFDSGCSYTFKLSLNAASITIQPDIVTTVNPFDKGWNKETNLN